MKGALASIADELYGLPPAEFTAARNTRVRELRDGDRQLSVAVQELRKSSPAAWVVNALVREEPDELADVLALGEAFRAAQGSLDRDVLADLGRQRRQLVTAVAKRAGELAASLGHPVSGSVLEEVAQTLQAAMADEDAAAAVTSGRLVRALTTVGLEVDLTDAVAVPDGRLRIAPAPPKAKPRDDVEKRELEEARDEAKAAEKRAKDAATDLEDVERRMARLGHRRDELAEERTDLEDQLRAVKADIASAEREARSLDRELDRLTATADKTRAEAKAARARVDALG